MEKRKWEHPIDEYGDPKSRVCTCKKCHKKFGSSVESSECPFCGTLHCPNCLRVAKGSSNKSPFWESGSHSGYTYSWSCNYCGWTVETDSAY